MTPALLDDLVRAAACEVLAVRGLDLAALPADTGVERPRNPAHGEYATSVALRTAGRVGVAPRELAGWLADVLVRRPEVADAEVAGPGFLNLRMTADGRSALVAEVLAAGDDYGRERRRRRRGSGGSAGADARLPGSSRPSGWTRRGTRWCAGGPSTVGAPPTTRSSASSTPTRGRRRSLRNAAELGIDVGTDLQPLADPREGESVCAIGHFPSVVASGEPHRVARYLEALADAFFDVHDACPVLPVGDADVTDLHRARLALVVAARVVLANGLGLLGVSAPERI